MRHPIALITLYVSSFLIGCGTESGTGGGGDPVVSVNDSDAQMNTAIETARATFDQFLDHWQTTPGADVGVKVPLATSDGNLEHIWFTPLEISDTQITGEFANDPVDVAGLSAGDIRTFERSEISDWMILTGNDCYGGYTIRVLSEMQPEHAPGFNFVDFDVN